jgi:hypothetical protein
VPVNELAQMSVTGFRALACGHTVCLD